MKWLIILFIFSLSSGCKDKSNKKIYASSAASSIASIEFRYGNPIESGRETQNVSELTWGPVLRENCIHSEHPAFSKKEFGPILKICFSEEENSESKNFEKVSEIISESIEILNSQSTERIRPDAILKTTSGGNANLHFYSIAEISNLAVTYQGGIALIGDIRILEEIKSKSIPLEIISPFETESTRLHTNFSLPYFSIIRNSDKALIIFPPPVFGVSKRSVDYLTLEISGDDTQSLGNFLQYIRNINNDFSSKCEEDLILISEYMGSSQASTGRFLEYNNPSEKILCSKNAKLKAGENEISLSEEFLFPHEVRLIVESSSPLHGRKDINPDWKKISQKIEIINGNHQDSWELPSSKNFIWNEEAFSLQRNSRECNQISSVYSDPLFCGDPGIEGSFNTLRENQCNLSEFNLTELNPNGVFLEGRIEKSGKFLEIHYIGASECKPGGLSLKIGDKKIPFGQKYTKLKTGDILIFGERSFFKEGIQLIDRKLDFLKPEDKIFLESNSSSREIFSGLQKNESIAFKDSNLDFHSVIFYNSKIMLHPGFQSNYLKSFYKNSMSPGEISIPKLGNAIFSEIAWMGSYMNSISKPGDEFIELINLEEGSLKLEIQENEKLSHLYFYISPVEKFTIIAESELSCFPGVRVVEYSSLALGQVTTYLNLKNQNNINLANISYSPGKKEGISQTKPFRLRASYNYTGYQNIWKNAKKTTRSKFIHPTCIEETFATPGEENEFEAFLNDADEISPFQFSLIRPSFESSSFIDLRRFSILPAYSEVLRISFDNSKIPPTISLPFSQNENHLLFFENIFGKDLKVIIREALRITGVMPNPENPQNEWVLFCNSGNNSVDTREYEIMDNTSSDKFLPYSSVKSGSPFTYTNNNYELNSYTLAQGECAYLIDPDSINPILRPFGTGKPKILTVASSSTIGNGISSDENLDLYKYIPEGKIHIHSYGNRSTTSNFQIDADKNEAIILKKGKRGESASDYEISKWSLE